MEVICECLEAQDISKNKISKVRKTCRAIIRKKDLLYMIYSPIYDDYTFPGGGIENNESNIDCLKREVLEEAGVIVNNIKEFGLVKEYRFDYEKKDEIFIQKSYYYTCDVKSYNKQNLEKYEMELGYVPRWIHIKDALIHNMKIFNKRGNSTALNREISVLKKLEEEYARI